MKKVLLFLAIGWIGFAKTPIFTTKTLIERKILNAGENVSIFIFDWDFDEKDDLIIGNKNGEVLFYKNIGSNKCPEFSNGKKIEVDDVPIRLNEGYSHPCVVQWDNENHYDLLIGDGGGNVWRALAINPLPSGTETEGREPILSSLEKIKAGDRTLNVGFDAAPFVFDVDEDGLIDLVCGNESGEVWFFRNIGRKDMPIFASGTHTLVGTITLDVGQNAKPFIVDWDNDGNKDLIVGNVFGNVWVFIATRTDTGAFVPTYKFEERAKVSGSEIDVGFYASPFVINWDRSGGYDLLVGAGSGEIFLFINTKMADSEPPDFNAIQKIGIQGGPEALDVGEYSKPQVVDWNNDGKKDLIVGDKFGKVKLFLNYQSFTDGGYFQVLKGTVTENLDVGNFSSPWPVDWNNDGKKDLIVGNEFGETIVFLNINTDEAPIFNEGTFATTIGVGKMASPVVCDWNSDGKKDLVVGCESGEVFLFLNINSDNKPIFGTKTAIKLNGIDLNIGKFSVPYIVDWNEDYKKDLLVGLGYGEIYLFINHGTDKEPIFTKEKRLRFLNGSDIRANSNAAPVMADWDDNDSLDLIIGQGDGTIILCLSTLINTPPSVVLDTPENPQTGNVNISYTLVDEDSDICSIDVSFSTDGGLTWDVAMPGNEKKDLPSSPLGVSHIFVWDSKANIGESKKEVIIKIIPHDEESTGLPEETESFIVDNTIKTNLTPIEVQGKNIDVGAYSGPFVCDWNNDGKKDLLVGDEGGYVNLFLNAGTDRNPVFIKQTKLPIKVEGLASPFVCDYNNDGKKDLLVGTRYGNVYYFENIGKDENPIFSEGKMIQAKSSLDVGNRAVPIVYDYNRDGKKDLIIGEEYGTIRLYINYGEDEAPIFATETKLLLGTGNAEIDVGYNAAPCIMDWNRNGKNDLIVGSKDGSLWLFLNYGDDMFLLDYGRKLDISVSGYSIPHIVDWDSDGRDDIIIGDRTGAVYLYLSREETNSPPYCIILPIISGEGEITIKFELYDIDGDTLSIIPEHSIDGINYKIASGSPTENLTASGFGIEHIFTWRSHIDLSGTKTNVYFRITPKDKNIGTPSSIQFLLNNLNELPYIENIKVDGQSGVIKIVFDAFDKDMDTITVLLDYRTNKDWMPASIVGTNTFLQGRQTFYWPSSLNLPETDTACEIKLTPGDRFGFGKPEILSMYIKNSKVSSKEVRKDERVEISFSPTKMTIENPEYDMVITIEKIDVKSFPGLSNTGRRISAIRKDRPEIGVKNISAKLTIPYVDNFSEEIEKSFVIYFENKPLKSVVDIINNTVSSDISSPGLYKIDTLFTTLDVLPYPNPCRHPKKEITFSGISHGKIRIFTLKGQLVKEISESPYVWDTKNKDGKPVASGIYIWFAESDGGKQKGILAIVR
ncbi:TPA: hypothetical protein DCX16_07085 [bacterium]|nr:hypothetical protein [bacterium]